MIPYVNAAEFPREVEDWCRDNEVSTHYASGVVFVENDGNAFATWLLSIGVAPEGGGFMVAIQAT